MIAVHWFKRIILPIAVFLACVLTFTLSQADEISQVKAAIEAKGAGWQAGETSMTRLSPEERKARLGLIKPSWHMTGAEMQMSAPPVTAPASLDWRNYNGNFVTPIRDQSTCGSCWAFATTAALESTTLINNNTPGVDLNLSEQVLISCGGAGNCEQGGSIDEASDYIRDEGLPVETCYPYTATNGNCANACPTYQTATYGIASWSWVTGTSPTVEAIRNALYTHGPLVSTMDVYSDFFAYSSGIYVHTSGAYQGGHAVLIVGYSDAGQYFIVKNSWGADWGESGYFRIAYSELNSSVDFGDYTIAYSGGTCSSSISPTSRSLGSSSGSGSIEVTAGGSCSWVAVSNASWITVTGGASGTGNGTVSYNITENTGAKRRIGTITIAGQTYTVTQAGVAPSIAATNPANGATSVSTTGGVTATFSETMKASTITTSSFTLVRGATPAPGSVAYEPASKTATFTPASRLALSTVYTATVTTAVQDDEDVALPSSVSWSFTTASTEPVVSNPGSSGSSGGGGGCFIATAAFGSPLEPHVQILRDFRDRYLHGHVAGSVLVQRYEDLSPPVARIISEDEMLKAAVRLSLLPLIGFAFVTLHLGAELLMAVGFFGVSFSAVALSRRRRMRGPEIHDRS
jgi:C1A family cysteine protease